MKPTERVLELLSECRTFMSSARIANNLGDVSSQSVAMACRRLEADGKVIRHYYGRVPLWGIAKGMPNG